VHLIDHHAVGLESTDRRAETIACGGKLGVAINDKQVGSVGNAALCKAFRSIYTDKNAVCTMRKIGEATSSSGSCITPTQGALLGAGVGYAVTKMLS
jgi:uncharacterized protein (DUF1697 family)